MMMVLSDRGAANGASLKRESFIADHPFLFYVSAEDIILFVGRVLAPEVF